MEKVVTLGKKEEFSVIDSKGRIYIQVDPANKCLVLANDLVIVDWKDNVVQVSSDFVMTRNEEVLLRIDSKKASAELNLDTSVTKLRCSDIVAKTQLVEEQLTVSAGDVAVLVADPKKKQVNVNGKLFVNGIAPLVGKISNVKANEPKNIEWDGEAPKTGVLMFQIVSNGKDKFAGTFLASKYQEEDAKMKVLDISSDKLVDISFVWKKNGDVAMYVAECSSDKWKGDFEAAVRVV